MKMKPSENNITSVPDVSSLSGPARENAVPETSRIAFFPGSFNPFTVGHASVVERGLALFDRIVIGVGYNVSKPEGAEAARERAVKISRLYAGEPRIEVTTYASLTVTAAAEAGAGFILRGIRSVKDFEYERDMADINRKLSGIETVIMFSLPELAALSSSVVRELERFGADISEFIP